MAITENTPIGSDVIERHRQHVREALGQAIDRAGSIAELARQLGVTYQAVQGWLRRGGVPARRAVEIEALYGISRHALIDPRLLHLLSSAHTSLI